MENNYNDKYLKYKAKYLDLQKLAKLLKEKNWPKVIEKKEQTYNKTVEALKNEEEQLKILIQTQVEANNEYYKNIDDKEAQKKLNTAKNAVKKSKDKVKKLEQKVITTNKDWKNTIVKASESKIKAAESDVNGAKKYVIKNRSNVKKSESELKKSEDKVVKAKTKLAKAEDDLTDSEKKLQETKENLNNIAREEMETISRNSSSTGLSSATSSPASSPKPMQNESVAQEQEGE